MEEEELIAAQVYLLFGFYNHGEVDFVKRLLNKDYRERLTAAQALSHPWLANCHDVKIQVDMIIYKVVKAYTTGYDNLQICKSLYMFIFSEKSRIRVAYILLCGSRPFWARTESGIFRAVLKAYPGFDETPWPSLSPDAVDFVKRLLNKDYRKRLTAAQALSHPWLANCHDVKIPLDMVIYKVVKAYTTGYDNLQSCKSLYMFIFSEKSRIGGTNTKGATLLHEEGAKEVYACCTACTHAVFRKGVDWTWFMLLFSHRSK